MAKLLLEGCEAKIKIGFLEVPVYELTHPAAL